MPFLAHFLKIGQAIVDAKFVQNLKFSVNMWFSISFKTH
jgi:hypothetical protein